MSDRKFKICRDYYDENVNLYSTDTFIFKPGLTVLVGCNGSGKTTLIKQLRHSLDRDDIPYVHFNNLVDGGNAARQAALFSDDFSFLATSVQSSEGENIVMNLGNIARKIGSYIRNNKDQNGLWIFLDAIDSGLSIDNIDDVKRHLFDLIFETTQDRDVYIIVSANSFELAREEPCMDVWSGKYVHFNNYDEYRQFILESRKRLNERYGTNVAPKEYNDGENV